ncbi:MAG: hypothetical protein R3E40_00240 [Rhodocyclaceae bacterium]
MSKPTPLSRTKNTASPSGVSRPNSIVGAASRLEYFQAFSSRFCIRTRSSCESPKAVQPSAIDTLGGAGGRALLQLIEDLGEPAQIVSDCGACWRLTRESSEDVVDQVAHALGGGARPLRVAFPLCIRPLAILLGKAVGEAVDAAQGAPLRSCEME